MNKYEKTAVWLSSDPYRRRMTVRLDTETNYMDNLKTDWIQHVASIAFYPARDTIIIAAKTNEQKVANTYQYNIKAPSIPFLKHISETAPHIRKTLKQYILNSADIKSKLKEAPTEDKTWLMAEILGAHE